MARFTFQKDKAEYGDGWILRDWASKGLRAMVLLYLKRSPDGSTAQDIEQGLDLSGNTVRPRLRELVQAGRVYDSGETRRLASGRKAIIWRAR